MADGPDHIVHAVHDLDAAGAFYERAGFIVGGRNRHPWGTHNRIVQLRDVYIELLGIGEPDKIVPHGPHAFSFGAFNRDFLRWRQGLSMLLLKSNDAAADARTFRADGIGDFELFEFARDGARPDGTTVQLRFSLAYARDPLSPDAAFAMCQHHFPENFWNPEVQNHANGARRIRGELLVAEHPANHQDFLDALTGVDTAECDAGSIAANMATGEIEIVTPVLFRRRTGDVIRAGKGAVLAALRFVVHDVETVAALLLTQQLAFHRAGRTVVVSAQVAFGATWIFEPADMA